MSFWTDTAYVHFVSLSAYSSNTTQIHKGNMHLRKLPWVIVEKFQGLHSAIESANLQFLRTIINRKGIDSLVEISRNNNYVHHLF